MNPHPLIQDIQSATTYNQQYHILERLANREYRGPVNDPALVKQFFRDVKQQHKIFRGGKRRTSPLNQALLQQNYPDIQYIHSPKSYGANDTTYGEMTYPGIQQLLTQKAPSHTVFLDIGSGNGKIPLYLANAFKRSIGVEIMPERYDKSIELKRQLGSSAKNVRLHCGDILNMSIPQLVNKRPTLVWMSNLCFPVPVNHAILAKLDRELPTGSTIVMSQEPTVPLQNIRRRNDMNIDMTWAPESTVYVYDKK